MAATGLTAAKRHTVENKDAVCFEKNVENLQSIIEFAKANNSKVFFFTLPAYKTYVENLEQRQLTQTINAVTQISNKDTVSAYYNLLTNPSFIAGDFYDADHLNEKGAKKLTIMIDSIIYATTYKK